MITEMIIAMKDMTIGVMIGVMVEMMVRMITGMMVGMIPEVIEMITEVIAMMVEMTFEVKIEVILEVIVEMMAIEIGIEIVTETGIVIGHTEDEMTTDGITETTEIPGEISEIGDLNLWSIIKFFVEFTFFNLSCTF